MATIKSTEEKAKAYDEAIKRLEDIKTGKCQKTFMFTEGLFDYIFPELKESENIRIIKAIKYGLDHVFTNNTTVFEVTKEQCLAWLEKQGEAKKIIPEDATVDSNDDGLVAETIRYKNEKQGEQKPADKVEPKFKVGDWIVKGDVIAQILDVQEQYYVGLDTEGKDFTASRFLSNDKIHLWTIQDAKDGDVLTYNDSRNNVWVCIFKEYANERVYDYCTLDKEDFWERGNWNYLASFSYIPATKEQRDLLFLKMKEAGYEWDAEKKELRKIEQNPVWSEEDEKIYQSIMDDTVQENQLDDKQILWLKSLKDRVQPQPRQEWKQENTGDLTDFENAMMHIGGSFFGQHAGLDPNDTNAIKKQANLLLELIPKQELSEEDEQYLLVCKNALRKYEVTDKWDSNIISQWLDNKLRYLRPQNKWKPSDEQIEALKGVQEGVFRLGILESLYQDLKKLREG